MTPEILHHTYSDSYSGALRWYSGGDKGAILYLHGIQSHGLWFETSASTLAESGFTVCLPDRRGSGLNPPPRGHVRHYQRWIDDHIELLDRIILQTKHRRVHVLGVSWGGKLALALAKTVPQKIASLTLIAPGLFPAVDVSLAIKLKIALAVITRSSRRFNIPLNEPELFTDNPDRREFIRQDNLRLTWASANFLYQSRRLDFFLRRPPGRLDFPVKLFLAGRERIIDNNTTLRYHRALRVTKPKQTAYYPEASHTLEFEKDNRAFLTDLQEWLNHAAAI
jgi:alpha-beta hydrolase superfamily lysophospholipase